MGMVSERAVAALAGDDVQHVVSTTTHQGTTEHGEWWFDQTTGDSRITHLRPPAARRPWTSGRWYATTRSP
ncbi:hypothetical protein ACFQZ4_22260 [Catellatospora coxensis]